MHPKIIKTPNSGLFWYGGRCPKITKIPNLPFFPLFVTRGGVSKNRHTPTLAVFPAGGGPLSPPPPGHSRSRGRSRGVSALSLAISRAFAPFCLFLTQKERRFGQVSLPLPPAAQNAEFVKHKHKQHPPCARPPPIRRFLGPNPWPAGGVLGILLFGFFRLKAPLGAAPAPCAAAAAPRPQTGAFFPQNRQPL